VGKKLYVGNLSYETSSGELETLFSQAGSVVEATVIQDRDSGRSKGFGFVEMAEETAAEAAIEQLNGSELAGRTIKVAEAKPRRPRGNGGYGGGVGYGGGRRW
jgi:RNA recognition motif-containing protein